MDLGPIVHYKIAKSIEPISEAYLDTYIRFFYVDVIHTRDHNPQITGIQRRLWI